MKLTTNLLHRNRNDFVLFEILRTMPFHRELNHFCRWSVSRPIQKITQRKGFTLYFEDAHLLSLMPTGTKDRDRQPMVRASVTESWAQLKTGNMILLTHYMYTNMIFLRNENIENIKYSYKSF